MYVCVFNVKYLFLSFVVANVYLYAYVRKEQASNAQIFP